MTGSLERGFTKASGIFCEEKGDDGADQTWNHHSRYSRNGVGFFVMMRADVFVPSMILAVVWFFHIIYFVFGVRTIRLAVAEEK